MKAFKRSLVGLAIAAALGAGAAQAQISDNVVKIGVLSDMFNADVFVEGDGFGLMAYGVSLPQQYRRAADIAVRLIEGAKPSDIPVEQPTRYELVVNLRAADEAKIVLPREFLLRADRVIR